MATLDNGFMKLKKNFGRSINRNAKLLMVIVAASNKYKINVKKAHSFMLNTWGGGGKKGNLFLKQK